MSVGDSIRMIESDGDNYAKNERSSAYGPDQFLSGTWLETLKANRPDLAQGKSDAELLAMRSDPVLSGQMRDAYAAANQATLAKAGIPVDAGTTYLAHFAGPGGAVKLLQSDPNTPASAILGPDAVKANPFLAKMTAGDVAAWASRKMGGSPRAQAPQAAPQAPMTLPSAQTPVFPQQPVAPPQAQQAPSPVFTMQPEQFQAPQINYAPRRPVNLAALQQALGNRASPYFPKG